MDGPRVATRRHLFAVAVIWDIGLFVQAAYVNTIAQLSGQGQGTQMVAMATEVH